MQERQAAGGPESRLRTGQHPRPQLYRLPHRLEELVPELPRPPIESSVARHLARGLRGVRAELGAKGAVLRRAGVPADQHSKAVFKSGHSAVTLQVEFECQNRKAYVVQPRE